ncbi:MAG: GTPase [Staphylothermus sp.]|nr:GTPase [Staphylothermus sp.]
MPVVKMKKDEMLKIFGPASVHVVKGEVEVLGKRFTESNRFVVHKTKSYIIRALMDSELDFTLAPNAQIQGVEENDPYLEWFSKAEEIIDKKYKTIAIVGGVDSGKSSFSILLSNLALEKGLNPSIIDADVGQADIGPPCFISMAYPSEQVIWMRFLKPAKMKFIGDIKPQNNTSNIIYKVKEFVQIALRDNREPVIIDTDGWINDIPSLLYKAKLLLELRPDVLIVLGKELYPYFKRFAKLGINIINLSVPENRKTRNREERRMLRSDKYREFLYDAPLRKVGLDDVLIANMPVFLGEEINVNELGVEPRDKVLYASRTFDTLYLVLSETVRLQGFEQLKTRFNVPKTRILVSGFENRTYVSIVDQNNDEYPGLIDKIDFVNRTIYYRCKYNIKPWIIKFSKIKLTEDFQEQLIE